jgi:Fe2+ or Zn2+ uptake regulation protein
MLGRKPVTQSHIIQLLSDHHLLSAPSILEKMTSQGHAVNKTSVYRALEKLLASGTICKQIFSEDVLLYELRNSHHDHLVCESCGKVEASPCSTEKEIIVHNFTVSHHHLTIFGTCADCSKNN